MKNMCLFCEVLIGREKTLFHQWSLMSPCCDWVCSQIKGINFPSFSITRVFPQSLFSLCRQHIFKYRLAVWLVSVLSVRCQTHSGTVWLAIRTHCGSRSRLSYYCDDCCGAIFENWSGLFVMAELGLSALADQKQWEDFTTCCLLCLILDQIPSDSVHQYWLT